MFFGTIIPSVDQMNLGNFRIPMAVILLVVGLILIIKGGDWFVDAAVWMSNALHIPKFLIGATIVSVATTLPEMIVSIMDTCNAVNMAKAGLSPDFSIAVGNAVGSVTANTGLILALSAVFVSGDVERKEFLPKAVLIIAAGLILMFFSFDGQFGVKSITNPWISQIPCYLLLIVFGFYMYQNIVTAKSSSANKEEDKGEEKESAFKNILLFIIGTAGIVLGADLLVENAKVVALACGVSNGIIGITLVAIGTSLPELITTITSIVKKQNELGVGNIIGANIIDLALILPICSFITGGQLVIVDQSRFLDMPALLLVSLIAVVPTVIFKKFHRWQGFALLVVYATYITLAVVLFNAGA